LSWPGGKLILINTGYGWNIGPMVGALLTTRGITHLRLYGVCRAAPNWLCLNSISLASCARRTCRVADLATLFGHAAGGRPAERLMASPGLPQSGGTILRSYRRHGGARDKAGLLDDQNRITIRQVCDDIVRRRRFR
jgi:hypothetical protein